MAMKIDNLVRKRSRSNANISTSTIDHDEEKYSVTKKSDYNSSTTIRDKNRRQTKQLLACLSFMVVVFLTKDVDIHGGDKHNYLMGSFTKSSKVRSAPEDATKKSIEMGLTSNQDTRDYKPKQQKLEQMQQKEEQQRQLQQTFETEKEVVREEKVGELDVQKEVHEEVHKEVKVEEKEEKVIVEEGEVYETEKVQLQEKQQHEQHISNVKNLLIGIPPSYNILKNNNERKNNQEQEELQHLLNEKRKKTNLSLVISHCDSDVDWMSEYILGSDNNKKYNIKDITVYSKCGQEVNGLQKLQQDFLLSNKNGNENEGDTNYQPVVNILPNVGRCDHSYATWIKDNYQSISHKQEQVQQEQQQDEENAEDIVVFLKDHHYETMMNFDFDHMFQLASSEVGFSCVMRPRCDCGPQCDYFPYMIHNFTSIDNFTLPMYANFDRDDNTNFVSNEYPFLQRWRKDMGIEIEIPNSVDAVPICYGGNFLFKKKQVLNQREQVWKNMEKSLSRDNNLIEGHYAERLWAPILTNMDETYSKVVEETLLPDAKEVDGFHCGMTGQFYTDPNSTVGQENSEYFKELNNVIYVFREERRVAEEERQRVAQEEEKLRLAKEEAEKQKLADQEKQTLASQEKQ